MMLVPRLRPYLAKSADPRQPRYVDLVDRLALAAPLRLTSEEFGWLDCFDGSHGLDDIRQRLAVPLERLEDLTRRLDENLYLDGPRFREIADGSVRPPRCVGTYEGDPEMLRPQLAGLFTVSGGPGLPNGLEQAGPARPDPNLCATLVPHIDFQRGGVTFAWGFKDVVEKTDASLFVIIGTSHYSQARFTLTRKDFQTPLGLVSTDQTYIDRLVRHYGDGLFDDEWLAHFPEHSIELEVVFLHYLFERKRPIRIVPLVVGSFFDCVGGAYDPGTRFDIAAMIDALRRAEAETPEPICYVISGDLAHIGPRFEDRHAMTPSRLHHSRSLDLALLERAAAVDMAGYWRIIAREQDERNICGLPPTYTLLQALRPARGQCLHYDQYVHPLGEESVSFASMTFYRR